MPCAARRVVALVRVLPPLLLALGAAGLRDEDADMFHNSLHTAAQEGDSSELDVNASARSPAALQPQGHDVRQIAISPSGEMKSPAGHLEFATAPVVVISTRGIQPLHVLGAVGTGLAQTGFNATAGGSRATGTTTIQCAIGSRCGTFSWCFPDMAFPGFPGHPPEVGVCMFAISVPVIAVLLPIAFAAGIAAYLMMQRWNEGPETKQQQIQDIQEKMMSATNLDRERCQAVIEHLYGPKGTPDMPQNVVQAPVEEPLEVRFSEARKVFNCVAGAAAAWSASDSGSGSHQALQGRRCWRRSSRGLWNSKDAPQISNGS